MLSLCFFCAVWTALGYADLKGQLLVMLLGHLFFQESDFDYWSVWLMVGFWHVDQPWLKSTADIGNCTEESARVILQQVWVFPFALWKLQVKRSRHPNESELENWYLLSVAIFFKVARVEGTLLSFSAFRLSGKNRFWSMQGKHRYHIDNNLSPGIPLRRNDLQFQFG